MVLSLNSPVLSSFFARQSQELVLKKKREKIVEYIFLRDRYFFSNLQETSRRAEILIGSDRSESAG